MEIEAGKFYTLDYNDGFITSEITAESEVVQILMIGDNFASVVGVMSEEIMVVAIDRLTN